MSNRAKWIVIILYLTWLLHESYLLVPKSDEVYQPYPYSEQWVSKQYYVFGACGYAISLILVAIIRELLPEARKIMTLFVAFQFLELIEYFLTYNREFFSTQILTSPVELSLGINITNIKVGVMFVVLSKEFLWTSGRH
jgi:hypothetical protein